MLLLCLLQNPHLLRPGCSLVRLSPHSRSAIHLKAPPPSLHRDDHLSVLPPPSPLSRLRPASSVFGRRRCTPPRWPPLTEPHTANYDVKPNTRVTRPYGSHDVQLHWPLSLQTKHEHISPQSQCHKSAVRAAPPLLSGGCYCCGDRLGTRRWRWLYLRCLLAVARQRLLPCSMLTLSSPAMLRRSLEGAVLCAVLPAKRNPNLIQIMFERSGIEPSPPKAPLLSLGGPMTSLQCGMSYFAWGCFFADLLPAFV